MKDKLIDHWNKAWKYYTIQIDVIAATVGLVATFLTDDYSNLLLTGFAFLNAIARVVKQKEV
jgi:hypothetical protein